MGINDLKLNEEGIVIKVKAEDNIKRRLMDIGLVKGAKVKPVLINKNIRAYLIKGTVIGIRNKDTLNIEVNIWK